MLRRLCVLSLLLRVATGTAGAQVFDGSEFRVNATTTFDQMQAAVAADASGRFVVVWMSDNHDGSSRGIFGRRFSASGVPLGADFLVNSHYPAVTSRGPTVTSWPGRASRTAAARACTRRPSCPT
jgi:hypothetical protein